MTFPNAHWLAAVGTAVFLVGCIHHEETVYRDTTRAQIQFENDKAARIFYETLSESSNKKGQTESKTQVDVPIVFHDERRIVSGPNVAFNQAVEICDSNHDGTITEQEARIYADNKHKSSK